MVKVDDDAFLRLDRLSHALTQWQQLGAGAKASNDHYRIISPGFCYRTGSFQAVLSGATFDWAKWSEIYTPYTLHALPCNLLIYCT